MGATQAAISKRLKAAEYMQKQGNKVPHELKPRDVERQFCMSEMLLERHKKKSFLNRIVTGDEKWIHYDNPKRKKSCVKPSQPAKYPWREGNALYVAQKGVLYYELLKPYETITGERYRTQLIRLKRAIAEKRPQYATRQRSAPCCYSG